jgi:sarcosine oxidase subunit gamma
MAISLTARTAFQDLVPTASGASAVVVTEWDGLGLATVLARSGQRAALGARWREHFASDLPPGPRWVESGNVCVIGTGPGAWLAIERHGGNAFAAGLRAKLSSVASVIDQSDGYGVLHLAGAKARATLEKLVPIDVHERAFAVGASAGTVAAHVGTLLWRLADDEQGDPAFGIAVPRSMAGSFWHALDLSGAEFGLSRRATD